MAAIPLAFIVASVVTWAACRWWYGKKLMAAAQRLQKSDKSRLFSQEQTQQARQQIEQLKGELASHQQSAAEHQAMRRRAQVEEALQASERAPEADVGTHAGRLGARLRRHPDPARLGLAPGRSAPRAAAGVGSATAQRDHDRIRTTSGRAVSNKKARPKPGLMTDDASVRACCPSETAKPLAG